jgi:putative acetyltransferase
MIAIRAEQREDYKQIHQLNEAAFEGDCEARLVDKLRESPAYIPELSLVAVLDGRIVGHIFLSTVHVESEETRTPVISLAPMAVVPDHQNQGIGSMLVREGLTKCKEMGHRIVVVVGHADFYPRFGFAPANEKGLRLPFEGPDEAFMVCELIPKALEGVAGTIVYPPEFADQA